MVEGGRMSDNKPPMTLYLQNEHPLHEEPWRDDDVTWCRDKIFRHDVGPYVQLQQFMEEVERRADAKHATEMRQYSSDFMEATQELAKEIMEGKA
jgi:hypothetical protein